MGSRLLVLVSVLVAGCLQSSLTPCADQYCPADKECHEPTGACYGPDQIAACDGLADFDQCEFGNFVGYCLDGICLSPRCGDGFVQPEINETCDDGIDNSDDPDAHCRTDCKLGRCGDNIVDPSRGEVCDDGNADAGDACAPDCGSDQTCGNGIVDVNEECDDGNRDARDGCSACLIERLNVQQLTGNSPRARQHAAIAYDAARERVVVFGGRSTVGGFRKDTMEWDGVRWREIKPATSPTGREQAAAVYDSRRHRVVLFGGDDGALENDVWEYDGARWIDVTPPAADPQPEPRRGHAMAYDPTLGVVVMFGGHGQTGPLGDTWEWNGSAWTDVTPASGPPATENTAMTYDPIRNQCVLFGGNTAAGLVNTTWLYDGQWTQATVGGTPPSARQFPVLVFDAVRGHVVEVTGQNAGTGVLGNIVEWDGASWTAPASSTYPFSVAGISVAYDAARRQLVSIAALNSTSQTFLRGPSTTAGFVSMPVPTVPPPRVHATAAYDARRGRVVMYGGHDASFTVAPTETWEWDGASWTVTQTPTGLARVRPNMTFSDRDGVIMVGGSNSGNADMMKWDGATWTQVAPPDASLGFRFTAGLVYDEARDRIVLHGGNFDDDHTYEWDGMQWLDAAPTQSGGQRHNFGMAYDPLRQRTVIVGGHGFNSQNLPQALQYDGATWTSIPEPGGQFGRGSRMVFDPHRGRLVYLFDPEDTGLQIWDFDGMTWEQRDPQPPIGPLYRPVVAYDAVRAEIVMYGGRTGGNGAPVTQATTVIGYQPNVAVEACTSDKLDYDSDGLFGCDDPDCAGRCTPTCAPGATCAVPSSTCGDGVCDPLEDCALCSADCGICTQGDCGDFRCDSGETATSCPGDCTP